MSIRSQIELNLANNINEVNSMYISVCESVLYSEELVNEDVRE